MTQVYRTLRVAPSDKGVLGVVIDAPPPHRLWSAASPSTRTVPGPPGHGAIEVTDKRIAPRWAGAACAPDGDLAD